MSLTPTNCADFDRLESLDFGWLCVELDLHPKLVRAWASRVKDGSEIGIEAEIRSGLHRLDPAFDDVAYVVVRAFLADLRGRHLYRPVLDMAEAAE